MALLHQLIIFHLILSISSSFRHSGATDCGGKNIATNILVNQHGRGEFKSIQDAIDFIKSNNDQWVQINIDAGTYTEKVHIPIEKPCIILKGAGIDATIIQFNHHQIEETNITYDILSHQLLDGTWNPTFSSSPSNVIVLAITFKNTFGVGAPALAAAIFGDKSVFYKCGFCGFQDTLLDSNNRHYFKDCYIQGEVDFIFGDGQSYYEDCVINATGPLSPPAYITAQGRGSENDTSGFIFRRGSIVGNSGNVKLGRAYGPYSRVIFYGTYFSSVVTPQRWDAWEHRGQESKFTYAAVECIGPGNNTTPRDPLEKNLTASELQEFSLSSFINSDGWLSNLPIGML